MAERFGIVIFGASGFTGKHAVEEIHRLAKNDKTLTWAIAGRSQSKLEKVIKDLQDKTGDDLTKIKILIADISDADSLKEMTKQATVVVNCCGPYRFYGEALVKACIDTHTNHVDVSGEPAYMEKMQLHYNEAAEKAGVYIISACGFDSIPADLGVIFLQQKFNGQLNSAETYLENSVDPKYYKFGDASIHYGTWESLVYGIAEQKELGPLRKQLYPQKLPQMLPKLKARSIIHKSNIVNKWCLPFPGSDRSVVYRSQRYLHETEEKRPAQMSAYVAFPSLFSLLMVLFVFAIIGVMAQFKFGRKLLLKYPRLFSFGFISHEGPAEELMNNTKFTMLLYGRGWDEKEVDVNGKPTTKSLKVRVSGTNPGYGATVTALIYSGITILKEADKMPGKGGVIAPGAAFAKTTLIENLNKNNLTFEVVD
ncbi:saccharopine dehydrogenase-like oxidoreductase [Arctopsyche grandis]|uniref:saccharopine dehydrogenase-like oxidoreductase n=1 Tax=Arctopsyche grandis TaxID=121162 RepID=UPI00406DA34F